MEKKYKRKEFLKMAILANAALYAKPLLGLAIPFYLNPRRPMV
jgi:hypothetical protein